MDRPRPVGHRSFVTPARVVGQRLAVGPDLRVWSLVLSGGVGIAGASMAGGLIQGAPLDAGAVGGLSGEVVPGWAGQAGRFSRCSLT